MEEFILINKEREIATASEPSTSGQVQPPGEDKTAVGAFENASDACQDHENVIAACTPKAETIVNFYENFMKFYGNIPLEDQEMEKESEISKADQEIENMVKQFKLIERYPIGFVEGTEDAWPVVQLAPSERKIEEQKHDWEKNHLAALREKEEPLAMELNEEQVLNTDSREDTTTQQNHHNIEQELKCLHPDSVLMESPRPLKINCKDDNPSRLTWGINEEMVILQALQNIQGLPLSMTILSPGHTPNWDAVSEYVNVTSVDYRSPKLCRQRYDDVIHLREEGKQIFDLPVHNKNNKSGSTPLKLRPQTEVNRPYRTSELHAQDNNSTCHQMAIQRHDVLLMLAKKRTAPIKPALVNTLLKNKNHSEFINELGIDIDHPVSAVEVAMHQAERIAREKENDMTEQQQFAPRMQLSKATHNAETQVVTSNIVATRTSNAITYVRSASQPQIVCKVTTVATSSVETAVRTANTLVATMSTQQCIMGTPIQTKNVVSVAGFSPAQLQSPMKRVFSIPEDLTKFESSAKAFKVFRIQQGIARPVCEQLQQQKVLSAAAGTHQTTTIQSLSPQVFVQAIQQASTSGGQVDTLVKTVPNAGVSGFLASSIGGTPVEASLTHGVKTSTSMTMRQLQMQQQLFIQKTIGNPKDATIAQRGVKGGVATQLIQVMVSSEELAAKIRSQTSSTLAGGSAGI